jgi:hypothetical protein
VLSIETRPAAAELGARLEIGEDFVGIGHALTAACAFSQSSRNFFNPMLVSGWL